MRKNLGLGILEEKASNGGDSPSDSDSDSDEDDAKSEGKRNEKDILGKLMGRKSKKEDGGIQEVADLEATLVERFQS